jgi:hypothetical protein
MKNCCITCDGLIKIIGQDIYINFNYDAVCIIQGNIILDSRGRLHNIFIDKLTTSEYKLYNGEPYAIDHINLCGRIVKINCHWFKISKSKLIIKAIAISTLDNIHAVNYRHGYIFYLNDRHQLHCVRKYSNEYEHISDDVDYIFNTSDTHKFTNYFQAYISENKIFFIGNNCDQENISNNIIDLHVRLSIGNNFIDADGKFYTCSSLGTHPFKEIVFARDNNFIYLMHCGNIIYLQNDKNEIISYSPLYNTSAIVETNSLIHYCILSQHKTKSAKYIDI